MRRTVVKPGHAFVQNSPTIRKRILAAVRDWRQARWMVRAAMVWVLPARSPRRRLDAAAYRMRFRTPTLDAISACISFGRCGMGFMA